MLTRRDFLRSVAMATAGMVLPKTAQAQDTLVEFPIEYVKGEPDDPYMMLYDLLRDELSEAKRVTILPHFIGNLSKIEGSNGYEARAIFNSPELKNCCEVMVWFSEELLESVDPPLLSSLLADWMRGSFRAEEQVQLLAKGDYVI